MTSAYAVQNRPEVSRGARQRHFELAIVVEQQNRSRDTIALATSKLWKEGHLNAGDKVVSISGSPEAITGQTSTIRVLDIGEDSLVDSLN